MKAGARTRLIERSLAALAIALAGLAVVVHMPGHVSIDSSEQLYEAATGRSVSWSPPLLSALLRLVGGGEQATAVYVLASVALSYGGLAMALRAGREGAAPSRGWPARALAIALLFANPLVFLYVGIVWKDVILAALLSTVAGLLLLAAHRQGRTRAAMAAAALLLLAPLLLVRQQGIVLAPPLAAVAAGFIAGTAAPWGGMRWWLRWIAVMLTYALLCVAMALGARSLIQGTDNKSTAVGFAAVQRYDLTGMLAQGEPAMDRLPPMLARPVFLAAVKRAYGPDRIDLVMNDPVVADGFWALDRAELSRAFWAQLAARPDVYLRVKAEQFAWLLGLRRLDRCLPLHVGVEGNPEYLRRAGVPQGFDRYDERLHKVGTWSRHLVLYRHWFYLALLLGACVYLGLRWTRRESPPATLVVAALAAGLLAFYAAYAATSIACDFRYLYPGLVGTTILLVYLLALGRPRAVAAGTRSP